MAPQRKILRVFQLIKLLTSKGGYSVPRLAAMLEVDVRTIYRYIHLLEEIGLLIDKDFDGRYFIFEPVEWKFIPEFDVEELALIKELVQTGARKHPLAGKILKKMYSRSEQAAVSHHLQRVRIAEIVAALREASETGRQVVLNSYHSAHRGTIEDRMVEPVMVNPDYESLTAFDLRDRQTKVFKLDRISSVTILKQKTTSQSQHQNLEKDAFGMTGSMEIWVSLGLTLRAWALMREEYPMVIDFLSRDETGSHWFHGPVRGFEGIGRFVLGLPGEVVVNGPESFKDYLKEKLRKGLHGVATLVVTFIVLIAN